jgi:hypothetical protein
MQLLFAVLLALTQPWLVVSDLHVRPFDNSPQPAAYDTDTNWSLFKATLAQMRRAEPNARVVVISGDFLAHHFGRAVAAAHSRSTVTAAAEAEMTRIERSFAAAFPHARFLIALGNNDDPCGDYSTAPDTAYLAYLARIWAPLVNRNGAAPNFVREFSHAGYYTAHLPFKNGNAVVLDDVYWSLVYHGCGHISGDPSAQQLAWFSRQIATSGAARNVVLMHIPPGVDENSTLLARRFIVVPYLRSSVQAQFDQIVSSNSKRVAFILAGHMHQNEFRLAGAAPVLVAPSVSPIYENNPAFLRLEVREDGTLRDYQEFAYLPERAAWSEVLDFDRAFGVDAFTAAAVREIHDRLSRDDSLRDRWSSAMVGGAPNRRATWQTWRAFWCAQTFSVSGYAACAGDQRRVAALPIAAALLAAIVLLALVAVGLRLAAQHRRA